MAQDFYTIEEIAALLRIRPGTVRNRISLVEMLIFLLRQSMGVEGLFPVAAYEAWKQRLLPQPPAADDEEQRSVAK